MNSHYRFPQDLISASLTTQGDPSHKSSRLVYYPSNTPSTSPHDTTTFYPPPISHKKFNAAMSLARRILRLILFVPICPFSALQRRFGKETYREDITFLPGGAYGLGYYIDCAGILDPRLALAGEQVSGSAVLIRKGKDGWQNKLLFLHIGWS